MPDSVSYILISAVVTVPAIAFLPDLLNALYTLVKMSSSLIGTPWP